MYFVKNNPKRINKTETNKKGYWLADSKRSRFEKAGRYYVSVLVDVPDSQVKSKEDQTEGIGIDLGLKRICGSFKW